MIIQWILSFLFSGSTDLFTDLFKQSYILIYKLIQAIPTDLFTNLFKQSLQTYSSNPCRLIRAIPADLFKQSLQTYLQTYSGNPYRLIYKLIQAIPTGLFTDLFTDLFKQFQAQPLRKLFELFPTISKHSPSEVHSNRR